MSYVVAVSDHIALRTVSGGVATERTVRQTNEWINDSEQPFPSVETNFQAPDLVTGLANDITEGTGVYFAFHSGAQPGSLDNLVIVSDGIERELEYWAGFLCARSSLGIALPEGGTPLTPIDIKVVLDHGDGEVQERDFTRERFDLANNKLGYPFPETVFKVGTDTKGIDDTSPAQKSVRHSRKNQAVYHEWTGTELVGEMENLDEDEKTLLLSHLEWVRGWFCYSTDVLKEVRKLMGTRSEVVRWGARLAVDGAPQGRPLGLTLTSDTGLDRQTHIVVGLSALELDTGRKFVSDERLLSAINKVTTRVVTRLKEYRWALKIKDREPVASELAEWVGRINERAGNSVIPKLFTSKGITPPARVDPDEEQEVVALWTALVTGGFLPGYEMRAVSGFKRYDGLLNITGGALESDGFLGVISTEMDPKQNAVIEFKVVFDSLLGDLEQKKKIPGEIDLVACWDCPELNITHGTLQPVYGSWNHERPIRGASYIWEDDTGSIRFPVIALRNVVAELLVAQGEDSGKPELEVLESRDKEKLV